jgi:hypothetical protein
MQSQEEERAASASGRGSTVERLAPTDAQALELAVERRSTRV